VLDYAPAVSKRLLRVSGLGVLLALSAWGAPALAADDASRAAARRMATAGVEAFQHDDYAVAADKLERAYKMLPVPSIGLWLARALAKQGRLVEASERYTEVGRLSVTSGDTAVQKSAQKDAATELDALSPRIPSVVVRVDGAKASDVKLTLDGAELSSEVVGEQQPVDPGKHRIEGKANGQVVGVDVSVAQSENKTLTLRFKPVSAAAAAPVASAPSSTPASAPPPEPTASNSAPSAPSDAHSDGGGSSRRIFGWSAIGLGAAGLVAGAVTGSLAISKKSKLDDSGDCVGNVCLSSTKQSELDSYATMRTVSSIGFIAGGVLAAAGVVLLVTAPSTDSASAQGGTWVRVSSTGVSAGGRF
jgi:hypothetical protein